MVKPCDCSAHNPSLHPNQFGGYHCLQLWPSQRWFVEEGHRLDQEAFLGGSFIRQGLLYIWITSIVQLKLMMLSLKVSRTRKATDSRSRIVSKQAFFLLPACPAGGRAMYATATLSWPLDFCRPTFTYFFHSDHLHADQGTIRFVLHIYVTKQVSKQVVMCRFLQIFKPG